MKFLYTITTCTGWPKKNATHETVCGILNIPDINSIFGVLSLESMPNHPTKFQFNQWKSLWVRQFWNIISKIRFRQKALLNCSINQGSANITKFHTPPQEMLEIWFYCFSFAISTLQDEKKSVTTNFKHLLGRSMPICDVCWFLIRQFRGRFWRKRVLDFFLQNCLTQRLFHWINWNLVVWLGIGLKT